MSDLLRILAVFALVLGNAIFVAAEYALVTARRTRLEDRAGRGSRSARVALTLMDEPVRFISTVQVGITVCGILLGAIGEPLVSDLLGGAVPRTVSFVISFLVLTYLSVVLGELVPKALSLAKSEAIATALAPPIDVLSRVAKPLVWLLDNSARAVTGLFGVEAAPAGMHMLTREDIRQSVAAAEDVGEFQQAEEEMLYKVFDFAGKEADEVMVPRPEVTAISVDLPAEEALAALVDSPFTRYPAYRGSLDEIVGVLHVRDLFSALNDRGIAQVEIEQLLRPPFFIPETKDLASLLADFRREKQHMAIVVDEYGAMQGIVTLEDLLEEIVGEIEDEFDLPDESVEHVDERTVRIDGLFPIDDFNEQFGTGLPNEDYHTVAGFVFGELGRAPEEGDAVDYDGVSFEVLRLEGSRIERLQVVFPEAAARGGGVEAAERRAAER
ncbi:MAG TPA: hemolysin family protein [Gaiellaceae bacterium]|nr:hemolysin family protein [Gaiellaceae bacterium]